MGFIKRELGKWSDSNRLLRSHAKQKKAVVQRCCHFKTELGKWSDSNQLFFAFLHAS